MILLVVLVLMVVCIVTESARIIQHQDLVASELHQRIAKLEKGE